MPGWRGEGRRGQGRGSAAAAEAAMRGPFTGWRRAASSLAPASLGPTAQSESPQSCRDAGAAKAAARQRPLQRLEAPVYGLAPSREFTRAGLLGPDGSE